MPNIITGLETKKLFPLVSIDMEIVQVKKSQLLSIFIIVVGIVHTFMGVHAQAQSQTSRIEKMDENKDGFISIKEAVSDPNLLAVFGKIDINGDGKISRKELEATNLLND